MLSSQIFQVFDNDHMLYFTKYRVLCITWLKKIKTISARNLECRAISSFSTPELQACAFSSQAYVILIGDVCVNWNSPLYVLSGT